MSPTHCEVCPILGQMTTLVVGDIHIEIVSGHDHYCKVGFHKEVASLIDTD